MADTGNCPCDGCGNDLNVEWAFCPWCGKSQCDRPEPSSLLEDLKALWYHVRFPIFLTYLTALGVCAVIVMFDLLSKGEIKGSIIILMLIIVIPFLNRVERW